MKIISVKYLDGYKLEVQFSNGEKKIADFDYFLRKSTHVSINKFLDKSKFKNVVIDTGFLSWNDGEMEISALSVYNEFCLIETCVDLVVVPQTKPNKEADKLVSDFIKKEKLKRKKAQAKK